MTRIKPFVSKEAWMSQKEALIDQLNNAKLQMHLYEAGIKECDRALKNLD